MNEADVKTFDCFRPRYSEMDRAQEDFLSVSSLKTPCLLEDFPIPSCLLSQMYINFYWSISDIVQ